MKNYTKLKGSRLNAKSLIDILKNSGYKLKLPIEVDEIINILGIDESTGESDRQRGKIGKGSDCAKSDYLGKGSCTDYWIGAVITCSCSCHDCGSGYSGDSNPLQFSICFISATT
jgi:hypothetical protein